MTVHSDLVYQEFVSPLYKKYEEDPNFTVSDDKGEKMHNIQYALLQECQSGGCFEPVLFEEEDGRQLVIGFKVKGKSDYLFLDGQYSKKDEGAVMTTIIAECAKVYNETGVSVNLLAYIGFGDAYVYGPF
jgi:hypothetical protein